MPTGKGTIIDTKKEGGGGRILPFEAILLILQLCLEKSNLVGYIVTNSFLHDFSTFQVPYKKHYFDCTLSKCLNVN